MESRIKIGEAAAEAGVSVQTLRFYEELGLLGTPHRTKGGFRLYGRLAIRRVRFIKKAQALGFTLEEAAELLAMYGSRSTACRAVMLLVRRKLADVQARIEDLRRKRKALLQLWGRRAAKTSAPTKCPMLAALAEGDR